MNTIVTRFLSVTCLLCVTMGTALAQQLRIGWLEAVHINGTDYPVIAKIDTGADNSSINAQNVKIVQYNGQSWARFDITNLQGQQLKIERPIVRVTRIKTKDGGVQTRNVIEMDVCMSSVKKTIEVNLVDRSHFKYQMLIGRSFLNPDFIVDSSAEFLYSPDCINS
ncbi:MAG: RimK/LysX family protein [Gammaproteobacteria bacterium]|nr:RimK/LysX family protein [Gammaproteobacteria bacterium]